MESTVTVELPAQVSKLMHDDYNNIIGSISGGIESIRWVYNSTDRHAVTLIAYADHDYLEPVEWVFARSIIAAGLDDESELPFAGEGDVTAMADAEDFILRLMSPEGAAILVFNRARMTDFLRRTYRLVPAPSQEVEVSPEWDKFLNDVLGYTPGETVSTEKPKGPTKELRFPETGNTYIVPVSTPDDVAEWEADLLHCANDNDDNAQEAEGS